MSEVRRQAAVMPRPNWGWQDDAACRGKEVVLFFGPDGERQPERDIRERKAKTLCASCPVRTECLAHALDHRIEFGVWGGMTERERRALLRRHPKVVSWRRMFEAAIKQKDLVGAD
jgi:WhiB family redox-sensing transcriptional regulator